MKNDPQETSVRASFAGTNCKAFTLMELVIILAIGIVLTAISWPALSHTRNQSLNVVDVYNHKQLMAATIMYAADQRESLPGNAWGTESDNWAHAANIPTYPGGATATTFPTLLSNQVEFCKRGQLFPYVKDLHVFKCPNDVTNQLYFFRNIYFTSYTWNGAVSGYGHLPAGVSYKITCFKPDSILQWEADEQTPFFFNDCSTYPDEGISSRHGAGASVGLISGASQRIPLALWYTAAYAGNQSQRGTGIPRQFLPTPLWCNPGVRSGLEN